MLTTSQSGAPNGMLRCTLSPQGCFYARTVQGGGSSHLCTAPRLISTLTAPSGASSASAVICGVRLSAFSRITRRWKAQTKSPRTTPESSNGSSFSLSIHSGVLQKRNANSKAIVHEYQSALLAKESGRSGRTRLTASNEDRNYPLRLKHLVLGDTSVLRLGLCELVPFSHCVGSDRLPHPRPVFPNFVNACR